MRDLKNEELEQVYGGNRRGGRGGSGSRGHGTDHRGGRSDSRRGRGHGSRPHGRGHR